MSQRERVAELLSQGLDSETIQARLSMSHRAYGHHWRAIKRDLGAQAC
jgi:DNA-binding CsgD family transcriptional regulator